MKDNLRPRVLSAKLGAPVKTWCPRPELNRNMTFRKRLLYPFELRGRKTEEALGGTPHLRLRFRSPLPDFKAEGFRRHLAYSRELAMPHDPPGASRSAPDFSKAATLCSHDPQGNPTEKVISRATKRTNGSGFPPTVSASRHAK